MLAYIFHHAVDNAPKPIWGIKPLLWQLTGNIFFSLWHHPKPRTPIFLQDPWDVAYYNSTTWEGCGSLGCTPAVGGSYNPETGL